MPETSPVTNTLNHLRLCARAKAEGRTVAFTTDVTWLVHMAINRRAGWPDDPSHMRGSAMPVGTRVVGVLIRASRYPKKAEGDAFHHLWRISWALNRRFIVRASELGEWKKLILRRLPERVLEEA